MNTQNITTTGFRQLDEIELSFVTGAGNYYQLADVDGDGSYDVMEVWSGDPQGSGAFLDSVRLSSLSGGDFYTPAYQTAANQANAFYDGFTIVAATVSGYIGLGTGGAGGAAAGAATTAVSNAVEDNVIDFLTEYFYAYPNGVTEGHFPTYYDRPGEVNPRLHEQ